MKKISAIVLAVALVISLCACGKTATAKYSLGDNVSTELVDFQMNYARMSIEAFNYYYNATIREAIPKTVETVDDLKENSVLTAAKGHTYVFLDYSLKNLDRTEIDEFSFSFKIKYNGEEVAGERVIQIENIDNYRSYMYVHSNLYPSVNSRPDQKIKANETRRYRELIDIATDVENIDDTFSVEVSLNDVEDATKSFEYEISAETISASVYDTYYKALQNPQYALTEFKSVTAMTDDEIKTLISGITEDTFCLTYEGWLSPGLVKFEQKGNKFKYFEYAFVTGTGYEWWEQYDHSCTIKNSKIDLGEYHFDNLTVKDLGNSWYLFDNGETWMLLNTKL